MQQRTPTRNNFSIRQDEGNSFAPIITMNNAALLNGKCYDRALALSEYPARRWRQRAYAQLKYYTRKRIRTHMRAANSKAPTLDAVT